MQHVSSYNFVDVRGSYSVSNYKRAEIEFVAPRLFHRRGELSVLGGWRDATQVGFYGLRDRHVERRPCELPVQASVRIGTTHPLADTAIPAASRRCRMDEVVAGTRSRPVPFGRNRVSRRRRCPVWAPIPTYVHTQATVGFDWRTSPGYSRRGGYYGITAHDYNDRDKAFGFQQVDYEAIQHVPVLRETWVLSFRVLARTTFDKGGQAMPFFMMPYPWRQLHAAGLYEPAIPRSEQPAPSGRVAHHGQPFSRLGGVLRRRKGDRAPIRSRLRRAEARLRLWRSLSRADLNAAPRRVGQGQRRTDPRRRDFRGLLRLPPMPTSSFTTRILRSGVRPLVLARGRAWPVRRWRLDPGAALL